MVQSLIVTTITANTNGISIFSEVDFEMQQRSGMYLTEQIGAKNFRIRQSDAGYETNFHLSGDPTLIIILKGTLKIELQNGDFKTFSAGDSFIAKDNLPDNLVFNNKIHGHKASVIGNEPLEAIHIKL
jgi:hypothetical protein